MFPTYRLTDGLRLVPGPDTPTVNFTQLREILLSEDLTRNEELSWTKGSLRFLDASVEMDGNRICFASFPRTGNSMTRKYIEEVTGIFTGTDMNLVLTN